MNNTATTKVGIFVTHPVQYQVPLWRWLSTYENLRVKVYYFSDQGVSQSIDPGFGKPVRWDVPLLAGYEFEFLSKRPIAEEVEFNISRPDDLLAREQFDCVLIHGYTHRFARQLIRRKTKYGYKLLLHGEFTDMQRYVNPLKYTLRNSYLKWFYSHVDQFCPIGFEAREHLKRRKIPDQKITITPYSVDDMLFESRSESLEKQKCRMELGIGAEQIVFLFSGKMIERKQPLLVLNAARNLSRDFPNLKLILLGDGEQFDAVKNEISSDMNNDALCPGFVNQSQLGRYFKAADVFVLPSNFDAWGLVVNEAMHFGLPCIVSDMIGCREDLVTDGDTGMIFRSGDLSSLEHSMKYFLENPEEADRMGRLAHQRIQSYRIEDTANAVLDAVDKTIRR